jgi:hypothetical protein
MGPCQGRVLPATRAPRRHLRSTPTPQADMILEVTWVDGSGNIHRSRNPSPEFYAISAGLGLTGIVTELKLQLTPPTNTKLITRYLSSDATMFDDIEKMLKVGVGWVGAGRGAWGWRIGELCYEARSKARLQGAPPASLLAAPAAPLPPLHLPPPPAARAAHAGVLVSPATPPGPGPPR